MESKIDNMREMVSIQGSDGNWNYDPYMLGMYNGMELMLSIEENREPVYKSKPDEWLNDVPAQMSAEEILKVIVIKLKDYLKE